MKLLCNRVFAIVISIIIAISSILISTNIKLSNKCDDIENTFYDGVDYDGYVHSSISTQLTNISNAVNGIIYVANNNNIDTYQLNIARNSLDSSISSKANISSIYLNYQNLINEYNSIIQQISNLSLNTRDTDGYKTYQNTVSNAISVINQSGYNEYVNNFIEKTYNKFPTKFIAKVSGVKKPELFT